MKAVEELCIKDLETLYESGFGKKPEQTMLSRVKSASWGNEGFIQIEQVGLRHLDIHVTPATPEQVFNGVAFKEALLRLEIAEPETKINTLEG